MKGSTRCSTEIISTILKCTALVNTPTVYSATGLPHFILYSVTPFSPMAGLQLSPRPTCSMPLSAALGVQSWRNGEGQAQRGMLLRIG